MKRVVLGVTGSIAAYKSLYLVRSLVKMGWEVKVIMTPSGTHFVTPLSFATLSKNPVSIDIIDGDTWNNHVDLGIWADVMILAPVTASTLSKLASGLSDNMLVATYLSAKCPVFIAPAMDLDMWKHPTTLHNLQKLRSYGNHIIPVGHGELASGLVGDGRMAEPEDIVQMVQSYFDKKDDLKGTSVMVTAGPTIEAIDPVRFIGNHSSGLMGICLAEECAFRGANVDLILGPTHLSSNNKGINTILVTDAKQMYEASQDSFTKSKVAILAAAVADYTPRYKSESKLKKKDGELAMVLDRTKDIAKELGAHKTKGQVTVGFALESDNAIENARKKLKSKNFDFIVLNSLRDKGAGFKHDTNKVSIIHKDNKINKYELKSKKEVAKDIIDEVVALLREN